MSTGTGFEENKMNSALRYDYETECSMITGATDVQDLNQLILFSKSVKLKQSVRSTSFLRGLLKQRKITKRSCVAECKKINMKIVLFLKLRKKPMRPSRESAKLYTICINILQKTFRFRIFCLKALSVIGSELRLCLPSEMVVHAAFSALKLVQITVYLPEKRQG